MPVPEHNVFQSYALTEEELKLSLTYNIYQLVFIQNEIAKIAQQLINLEYDPLNPVQMGLDRAMLTGQKSALMWLIETINAFDAKKDEAPKVENPNPNPEDSQS